MIPTHASVIGELLVRQADTSLQAQNKTQPYIRSQLLSLTFRLQNLPDPKPETQNP